MADLNIEIAASLGRFEREMAKVEARLTKMANGIERSAGSQLKRVDASAAQTAANLNRMVGEMDKTGRMSGQMTAQIQNAAFQFQDLVVQISSGTSATRALGQQLPQLLGGFGAMGAVLGLVAAVALPLGASLLGIGDSADALTKKMEALEKAVSDYRSAVDAAKAPTADLVEQYGFAAGAARELLEELSRLARLEAVETLQGSIKSLESGLGGIKGLLDTIDAEKALGLDDSGLVAASVEQLKKEYGLTIEQARELNRLLASAQAAQSLTDKANRLAEISRFLEQTVTSSTEFNNEMHAVAKAAAEGSLEAMKLAEGVRQTETAAKDLSAAAEGITFSGAIIEAQSLAQALESAGDFARSIGRNIVKSVTEGDAAAANKGIFDLIKRRESGGDYNATLDNGAYTGGPRDLVNMTINEVLAMQRQMLAHPANKKNSSAAGAYQIVKTTLEGLVKELGLTGEELYSREMQDRLAAQLLRRRRGQGLTGLRNEWEGLKYVDDETLQKALGQQSIDRIDPEVAREQAKAAEDAANAADREANAAARAAEARDKARAALASDLVSQQKAAELERQRADQIAAINAGPGSDAEKAAAIAQVNAEMQRQITIMALMEEAKRRQVDIDTLMVGSTMTYRQAIEALGETAKQRIITDQKVAEQQQSLAEAQAFADQQMQALQDGFIDAIIAGESFADVLKNVAAQMAKAWAQAALFGSGPLASQGGGGLFAGLFGNGGLLSQVFGGFRASGGPVSSGRAYVVGERGPEIIVPRAPGQVIPNHKLGGSGGSMSMVIDLRGTTGDDALDRKMQAAGARILAQAKAQAPGWVAENQKRTG